MTAHLCWSVLLSSLCGTALAVSAVLHVKAGFSTQPTHLAGPAVETGEELAAC